MRLITLFDQLASDIRHSLRVLRNAPLFAAVAILSLALGIGANTAIFTIVNAVMLKALPVTEPERLVQISLASNGQSARTSFTYPIWENLRDQHADLFDGAFAVSTSPFEENEGGQRRSLDGLWVSGQMFEVLGIRPWIGRMLTTADDRRGGGGPDGPAIVISYPFWRDRYGASPDALGRTLKLGGQPFTIVGVTPPGFFGVEVGRAFSVAVPLGCEPLIRGKDSYLDERGAWWLNLIGRVRHDRTVQDTQAALQGAMPSIRAATARPQMSAEARKNFLKEPVALTPAATGTSNLRQRYRVALFTLLAVVGLVLLIACANLANLLLARATARRKEFAVRLALGASRPRLVRQLLIESLLLAGAGAALGLLLAHWASRLLVQQLTPAAQAKSSPVALDLTLDWRVLGFTIAATIATALLFGLAPAFRSTDLSAGALMKSNTRSIASGWTRFNLEKLLIATQIALSLVLVFGASLFVRSFASLATLDPGFKTARVLTVGTNIRRMDYPVDRRPALYEQIGDVMRNTPGVQSVASVAITVLGNGGWDGDIDVDGFTPSSDRDKAVHMNRVSPGYFAAMSTAIYAGRDFTAQDTLQSPRVALINQTLARKFFPGKNPVGQHYTRRQGPAMSQTVAFEIIGVVQDSKYENMRDEMPPTTYTPNSQDPAPGNGMSYVVRTAGDPTAIIPSLSHAIAGVHKDISFDFGTLDAQVEASVTQERILAMLAGFFGALALLVAGVGLYGVMWLAMTRRRGEIGIRMALGAESGMVIRMVLREVATITAMGFVVGAAIAIPGGQLVSKLLFGITPTDTSTWLLAIALLGSVAALAGYLPARRAAHIDPMAALRDE